MQNPSATVSTNVTGEPELGPELVTVLKGIKSYKRRAVVGWNHMNDTPDGRRSGKIWCWVSEGGHFQVYDENFNRSPHAGDVRFCGVANFTMVRMFHPYWTHFGRVPRDMNPKDKERCRHKYMQLIRRYRIQHNLPVDDEPDNPVQPGDLGGSRQRRVRTARRLEGGRARRARVKRARVPRVRRRPLSRPAVVTGDEEEIGGAGSDNPLSISDEENRQGEVEIMPAPPLVLRHAKPNKSRLGEMNAQISSIFGTRRSVKREDSGQEQVYNNDDSPKGIQTLPIHRSASADANRSEARSTNRGERTQTQTTTNGGENHAEHMEDESEDDKVFQERLIRAIASQDERNRSSPTRVIEATQDRGVTPVDSDAVTPTVVRDDGVKLEERRWFDIRPFADWKFPKPVNGRPFVVELE